MAGASAPRTSCATACDAETPRVTRGLERTGAIIGLSAGIGLETVGISPDPRGVGVDARLCAGERLWAIGDVTGLWPLTHVGKYQARIVAESILGEPREAHYDAVPRVTFTDPQAAAVGATEDRFSATVRLADVAKTATYTHAYAESNGYLTLLSDGSA